MRGFAQRLAEPTTMPNWKKRSPERSKPDANDLIFFFMIGLPEQTYESVMETVEYCGRLMERFNTGGRPRLFPFISPFCAIS